jgi:mitochondrial splicing suppressor protein 51
MIHVSSVHVTISPPTFPSIHLALPLVPSEFSHKLTQERLPNSDNSTSEELNKNSVQPLLQINMAIPAEAVRQCNTCHVLESETDHQLKHCAKCPTTLYCSRECQKSDWKSHKLVCAGQKNPAPTGPHNPGFHGINAFLGLDKNDYLHSLPEKEAFAQLIDCFRMRVEDEHVYGCNNIGVYAGEDPRPEFREFLDLAETREGILPAWWSVEKRKECEGMAVDGEGWNDINCAVEKSDIMEHYGDNTMPMKLRVLGEKIYGKGFM